MKSKSIPVMTSAATLHCLGQHGPCRRRKGARIQVPGGLALSESGDAQRLAGCRRQSSEDKLNLILANPVMINSLPGRLTTGNGMHFPTQLQGCEDRVETETECGSPPFCVSVPDTLAGIGFMVKDSGMPGHGRMGMGPV